MNGMMFDFFQEIGYEISMFLSNEFRKLLAMSLNIENELAHYVLSPQIFKNVGALVYSVATGLLILKTLHKGMKIYLLNRDGDADVSPIELVKGYVTALVTAISFPFLYTYLANFTIEFSQKVSEVISGTVAENYSFAALLESATNLVDLILVLVLFIFLGIFYFSFLKRGAELLILRLGMPFACLGLIDSDNGCFKPYLQQIFKCAVTGIVELFCIEIAIAIVMSASGSNFAISVVYAISFLMMAKATPTLLNQFMISSQGGGAFQKVSSFAMTANAIRSFIK